MPMTDLPGQAGQLRELAQDFEQLYTQVRDTSCTPGTDTLHTLSPLVQRTQALAATAITRLTALDGSTYTDVSGSRETLATLACAAYSAALAAADLTQGLSANPYDGASFAGQDEPDEQAVRAARHAAATPVMARHIADAAHQLDLAAVACHYTATAIAGQLPRRPGAAAPAPTPYREPAPGTTRRNG
ncbi:hypothetical protein [Streptomyces sp. YIM 98790]|uniref:hypothetical protein n=1 Tax=Streptomyces sp. YIM 98790 TaxID=2689077 RepID=UPI0014099837|nr:hypothetical protein [Streptomyces sp. YIM 98790]